MNLELSANYASNVILVKRLRALKPGLPTASLGPLPGALAKMRLFPVLRKTCPYPRARGSLDLADGHFRTEIFAKSMAASHLPGAPVYVGREGDGAVHASPHTFVMEGTFVASGDPAEIPGSRACCLCRGICPRTILGGNTHLLQVHVADPSWARCQVRVKV